MNVSSSGQKVMSPGDEDQRYRITIILAAEKRPKYWEFHCPRCRSKICELSGIMLSVSDTSDLNAIPDYQPAPQTYKCKGMYCRYWYEFVTLSGR